MKQIISLTLAFAMSFGLVGCNGQATAASVLAAAGPSVAAVVVAISPNNAALAAKIKTDFAAASAAVTAWKKGTACQDVEQALNLVISDLNLIPATSQYATLITIAIAGVESVLAVFPTCQVSAKTKASAFAYKNPDAFKKAWNSEVAKHSELPSSAKMK